MKSYEPSTYGDAWAAEYDDWVAGRWSPPGEVDFLARLASGGRALELGVGTGRVAIPLAERGVRVVGVDASEAMLARLRERSDGVETVVGDMAEPPVEGPFDLVYCVFNTFFGLLTQDDQLRAFRAASSLLAPGGAFVLHVFVPDLSRFDRGQRVAATEVEIDRVSLAAAMHDRVAQTVSEQKITLAEGEVTLRPVRIRYAYPAELDLMARLAGLRLRDRLADFLGAPFTSASDLHVSVYEPEPA